MTMMTTTITRINGPKHHDLIKINYIANEITKISFFLIITKLVKMVKTLSQPSKVSADLIIQGF